MRVTVESVRFDGAGLAGRLGERLPAMTRALGEAVTEACEPYVPYRTGALCRSVSLSLGTDGTSAEIRWDVPYAAECYYASRPFSKRVHPHACARWAEAARAESAPAWVRAAAEAWGGASGSAANTERTG